jgi:hypothetical protein
MVVVIAIYQRMNPAVTRSQYCHEEWRGSFMLTFACLQLPLLASGFSMARPNAVRSYENMRLR